MKPIICTITCDLQRYIYAFVKSLLHSYLKLRILIIATNLIVLSNINPAALAQTSSCYEVEIAVAADNDFYNLMGNSVTNVSNHVNTLITIANTYFEEVNVKLKLVELIIFTNIDPYNASISNPANADTLLNEFRKWAISIDGFKNNHDVAALISGRTLSGAYMGAGYLSTACNNNYHYSLVPYLNSISVTGLLLARNVSFNLGVQLDGSGNNCLGSGFIMGSIINLSSPPNSFSTCSQNYFQIFLNSPNAACIYQEAPKWVQKIGHLVQLHVMEAFKPGM